MAVSSVAAPPPPADAAANAPLVERLFPNNEWVLLVVIAVECVVFGMAGHNFASAGNAFEITRLGVEIGLLALAMTPIIVTGGIDLSVGSMMGLAAIVLGWLWRDVGLPMPAAMALTLLLGVAGGMLNAALITRLKFPPLIVTLGTLSLFRGIAEGVTGGIQHYSGFPESFLHLGQGYVGGVVPTQLFIFVAAAIAVAWWLHRTSQGRALYAIGHSAEGARYAGIPVSRRVGAVYVLSGLASSLAAVIYVAHLGQAKSDAGTGYELMAITGFVARAVAAPAPVVSAPLTVAPPLATGRSDLTSIQLLAATINAPAMMTALRMPTCEFRTSSCSVAMSVEATGRVFA